MQPGTSVSFILVYLECCYGESQAKFPTMPSSSFVISLHVSQLAFKAARGAWCTWTDLPLRAAEVLGPGLPHHLPAQPTLDTAYRLIVGKSRTSFLDAASLLQDSRSCSGVGSFPDKRQSAGGWSLS